MNAAKRVMLLVDADNVSADVVDQAVARVMAAHGAIHVRRAYCTAESALANLKLFKAHSIRPIVNLSTGKNSTDIALAVDAVDLVISERPDVVVIVSSDSDFAPLVIKLREKGCRVEGIGQQGKTGEDSKPVYDDFTDIAHRKAGTGSGATASASAPTRKRSAAGGRRRAEPAPLAEAPAEAAGGRERSARTAPRAAPGEASVAAPAAVSVASPSPEAGRAPAAPDPAGESEPAPARRAARSSEAAAAPESRRRPARGRAEANAPAASAPTEAPPVAAPAPRTPMPDDLRRILAVLPELARGGSMELGVAAERLRSEDLLAKNAPSTKLFRTYPEWFVLTPERQPNKVQYRGAPRG